MYLSIPGKIRKKSEPGEIAKMIRCSVSYAKKMYELFDDKSLTKEDKRGNLSRYIQYVCDNDLICEWLNIEGIE